VSTAAHCAPAPRAVPEFPSYLVSLFVAYNHPLLQLKRALDWQALQAVMVRHWRAAGKNVEGGLPFVCQDQARKRPGAEADPQAQQAPPHPQPVGGSHKI
jgi:hypothetical protein